MIKVAGYCRVSTDKEDQIHSFASQQRYFREYITRQPDWELYKIYADEGVTGTSTKKRTQFNRMIQDAYLKKFDLVITKEVSRFSRNILDAISYTRELKNCGITVLFLSDNICTSEPDAELRLSIMASLAQEESRKTSERVIWGQTRQMEKGVVFGRSLLGYDVKDGNITINPDGAKIVQLIFHKYTEEQICTSEIARFLTKEGYCTSSGRANWKANTIIKILKNEKYTGDLIQKKTYTPNYLTHEKKKNAGAVPLICIRNHHEPIISRELWSQTQNRLKMNNKHEDGDTGHSSRYLFSGKIRCGECGSIFVGRLHYAKNGSIVRKWGCGKAVRDGTKFCNIGWYIRDEDALSILKTAWKQLNIDKFSTANSVCRLALDAILADNPEDAWDIEKLIASYEHIQKKKIVMMDSYFSQEITKQDMQAMNENYDKQLDSLRQHINKANQRKETKRDRMKLESTINTVLMEILNGERENEVFLKSTLDNLTAYKNHHVALRLKHIPQVFHFSLE